MQNLEVEKQLKLQLYIQIVWGMLSLFLFVGLFVNKDAAVIGMAISSIVWVQMSLLLRAFLALFALKSLKTTSSKKEE